MTAKTYRRCCLPCRFLAFRLMSRTPSSGSWQLVCPHFSQCFHQSPLLLLLPLSLLLSLYLTALTSPLCAQSSYQFFLLSPVPTAPTSPIWSYVSQQSLLIPPVSSALTLVSLVSLIFISPVPYILVLSLVHVVVNNPHYFH